MTCPLWSGRDIRPEETDCSARAVTFTAPPRPGSHSQHIRARESRCDSWSRYTKATRPFSCATPARALGSSHGQGSPRGAIARAPANLGTRRRAVMGRRIGDDVEVVVQGEPREWKISYVE